MLSGSSSISRASVEVSTLGCAKSNSPRRAGSEPVAITMVGAEISSTPSAVSTATRSGATSQPSPWTTLTPRVAHACSTPPRIRAAMPIARSRIDRPAHPDLADRDPPLGGLAQTTDQLGPGEQGLGGDAAAVDAGPPEQVALHQHDVGAELGRPQRRDVAGGTPAQHDDAGVRHGAT